MPAVIDTNLLYAWRNRNDQLHTEGKDVIEAASDGNLPKLHIPDVFFQETCKHIHNQLGYRECIRTMDALVADPQFSIIPLNDGDLRRGRSLFRRNNELELPDAIAVAYMRREQIEHIYSCDDDFDRFDDLTRLNSAINPHAS